MTDPGIYVRGATTALTRRTVLRKAFLSPWDPLVDQAFLYCMADAQRHTGMAVHHSVRVISHHHTSVTPSSGNLPEFTCRFHRDVSCALHALLCERRYDAPRELFDDRSPHKMRLLDAAAQASHLIYEHLNTVAAGLVRRPEQMPQFTFDWGLWKTGYIEVERPDFYFQSSRPEHLRLHVTPPPELYRAFGGDLDALVHHMRKLTEDGLGAIAAKRIREPLGARAVRRLHPWSEPRTLRESGGKRVPTFRIGARGIVAQQGRRKAGREVTDFRHRHHATRVARRDGVDADARYPYGTYAARVYRGEPVEAAPPAGAIVAQPGATLDEVKAELEGLSSDTPHPLIDEVRAALLDEAADIVEENEVELRFDDSRSEPSGKEDSDGARAAAKKRHRFDKRPGGPHPVRIVTLRDRRSGPPRRGPGTPGDEHHGADPPD